MKKRLITFRIPPDLDDMAQNIAEEKGKTKTDIFIIALAQYINNHGKNWLKKLFK
jgi:predicted transcriptional regulator